MSQTHKESDTDQSSTPRWVKLFGITIAVVILLVVIIMVASGGTHGPDRHMPSNGAGGSTAPIAHGVQLL